jgi:pimeloyl-ACP methyl ester carboxylesterase
VELTVRSRDGVRLACRDYGGTGPAALLLHGLAGDGEEWAASAGWLRERCRVLALDARGHGESERLPQDVSPAAHISDVAFVIEELALAPVILIGQSLGGHTALLTAAERPDLVRALVVAEASPAANPEEPAAVEAQLRRWRDPPFDVDVLVRTLREAVCRSYWDEWVRISCPVLVVRASEGALPPDEALAMVEELPAASLTEIPAAGHDVHLDRPDEWRRAVVEFLDAV